MPKALVIGRGVSGNSAAAFYQSRGYQVSHWDSKDQQPLPNPSLFDRITFSPGVPLNKGPFRDWHIAHGPNIWSEIDLALEGYSDPPIVAITGTNGKSTVTALLGHILTQAWGSSVCVGGNLGYPPSQWLLDHPEATPKAFILELSSYQLETTKRLRNHGAIITNLAPNHLDRYDSLNHYYETKLGIFRESSWQIALADKGPLMSMITPSLAPNIDWIEISPKEVLASHTIPSHQLIGIHNQQNVAMACTAALRLGLDWQTITRAVASFPGLPHRLQQFNYQGRIFINDSKSTSAAATEVALNALTQPCILLLGGRLKGDSFSAVASHPAARHVIAYGEGAPTIAQQIPGCHQVKTLDEALKLALDQLPSLPVLLSPGCSSFDQFKNFEDRGEKFQNLAKEILGVQKDE